VVVVQAVMALMIKVKSSGTPLEMLEELPVFLLVVLQQLLRLAVLVVRTAEEIEGRLVKQVPRRTMELAGLAALSIRLVVRLTVTITELVAVAAVVTSGQHMILADVLVKVVRPVLVKPEHFLLFTVLWLRLKLVVLARQTPRVTTVVQERRGILNFPGTVSPLQPLQQTPP
jgi:hypothetical protein